VLTLIWAMDRNRLIGARNRLPWPHIPADMRWFRRQTMGKPVIMGRATFASIGRPLPDRRNIVLSRSVQRIEGVEVVAGLDALRALRATEPESEWMVIGGATIYRQLLPEADRLLWTEIDHSFEGDSWFPPFDAAAWQPRLIDTVAPGADSPYPLRFIEALPLPAGALQAARSDQ